MTTAASPAEWTRARERGSLPLIRCMAWMSLKLGRPFTRLLLRVIAAYFFVFGGRSGTAVRAYLRRLHGREPTAAERHAVYFAFASTLHDRVYFLKDRFALFDVRIDGAGHVGDEGTLLMGAHFGSFEALRACGRLLAHRRVAMAMYEENARRINGVLEAVDAAAFRDVVPLGRVDSMLAIADRLEAGDLVGFLADRTLGGEPAVELPFLGEPARFPTGPMRIACALRRPVLFMVAIYRGGNRYDVRFEPIADFRDAERLSRAERQRAIEAAVARYAGCLERCCREAPDNWFNFHDFWKRP